MQREDFLINNFSFEEEVKKEEGEKMGIEKVAQKLKQDGIPKSKIIELTGISEEELNKLVIV